MSPRSTKVVAYFVLLLSVAPIFYLLKVVNLDDLNIFQNTKILTLVAKTFFLATTVALITMTLGFTFAFLTKRTDLHFKKLWNKAVILSMAIPSYVMAYSWLDTTDKIANLLGAVFILSLVTTPLVYLSAKSAIENLDFSIEEVSMSLGKSRIYTILRVVFPQLKRALLTGGLLAILYVITDFGAVSTLRVEVFTWVIYTAYRASFDPSRAASLATLLMGLTIVFIFLENRLQGGISKNKVGSGAIRNQQIYKLGKWNLPFQVLLAIYTLCAIGLPIAKPIFWLFQSVNNYEYSELMYPLFNTLWLGFIVVVISVLLAFFISLYSASSRTGTFIEKTIMTVHGLPGIVIALAFVFIGAKLLYPIYQEWPLVIIALTSSFLYLAIGSIRNSMEQFNTSIYENGILLSKSKFQNMRKILAPLAFPGIKSGALLIIVATAKELPITLLLRPTGEDTLATLLWSKIAINQNHAIAPIAITLIIITIIPIFFVNFIEERQQKGSLKR